MSKLKPYLPLYKKRDFSNLFTDTFSYFLRNIGPLSKLYLIWVMPVVALSSLFLMWKGNVMTDLGAIYQPDFVPDDQWFLDFGVGFLGLYVLSGIAGLLMIVATCSYMRVYEENDGVIENMVEVNRLIKAKTGKVLGYFLLYIVAILLVIAIVVGAAALALPLGIILGFAVMIGIIYVNINLLIAPVILVMEDEVGVIESISRAFRLMKGHFWLTLIVIFILGMLIGIVQYIFMIPMYIIMVIQMIGVVDGAADMSTGAAGTFSTLFMIAGILYLFIMRTIPKVLIYGSCRDEKEGLSIETELDQLEDITPDNPYYGNEGDF